MREGTSEATAVPKEAESREAAGERVKYPLRWEPLVRPDFVDRVVGGRAGIVLPPVQGCVVRRLRVRRSRARGKREGRRGVHV